MIGIIISLSFLVGATTHQVSANNGSEATTEDISSPGFEIDTHTFFPGAKTAGKDNIEQNTNYYLSKLFKC